jgi:hypothetical protein
VRQRKEEQEEQARHEALQRKKEREEEALQQKEEQEEHAPKARGKYMTFDNQMEDLKLYKETHGHANVTIPEDKSLAQFCAKARHARKNPGKGVKLTDERTAAFDGIGFNWTSQLVSGQFWPSPSPGVYNWSDALEGWEGRHAFVWCDFHHAGHGFRVFLCRVGRVSLYRRAENLCKQSVVV